MIIYKYLAWINVKKTYDTPLTAPPFATHTEFPAALKATETGNSPSLDTASPRGVITEGFLGSIAKAETVFEPA
jgi:hypothetical protein